MKNILSSPETYIQGNVEKLLQVANVEGDIVIVTQSAGAKAVKTLEVETENKWEKQRYAQLVSLFEDTTNLINVTIRSERFGKRIKLKVPDEIRVGAFVRILIDTLGLPKGRPVEELGISFKFTYILQSIVNLPTHQTLKESGVRDGSELHLHIDITIADPLVEKLENELHEMHSIQFAQPPGEEWRRHARDLEEQVATNRRRLYESYAADILREPWFEHLRSE